MGATGSCHVRPGVSRPRCFSPVPGPCRRRRPAAHRPASAAPRNSPHSAGLTLSQFVQAVLLPARQLKVMSTLGRVVVDRIGGCSARWPPEPGNRHRTAASESSLRRFCHDDDADPERRVGGPFRLAALGCVPCRGSEPCRRSVAPSSRRSSPPSRWRSRRAARPARPRHRTSAPPPTSLLPATTSGPSPSASVPGGSAATGQTDTDWGRIWDSLPAELPDRPGLHVRRGRGHRTGVGDARRPGRRREGRRDDPGERAQERRLHHGCAVRPPRGRHLHPRYAWLAGGLPGPSDREPDRWPDHDHGSCTGQPARRRDRVAAHCGARAHQSLTWMYAGARPGGESGSLRAWGRRSMQSAQPVGSRGAHARRGLVPRSSSSSR